MKFKILGISASLRNARRGFGNVALIEELNQISNKAVTLFNWCENDRIKECLSTLLKQIENKRTNKFEEYINHFSPEVNYNKYKNILYKITRYKNELES